MNVDQHPGDRVVEIKPKPSAIFSAAELQKMVFPPINWTVPGYVPEGLTMLGGKPKKGKSWLCLDWAIAVAAGAITMGDAKCEQGDVLYAALEDPPRRLQRRMDKLLGVNSTWPAGLSLLTEMPRMREGGATRIREWIAKASNPRLVVIDVLARVRSHKGPQETLYDGDYASLNELKAIADETGIAVLIVHHLRKAEADDPLDAISGSTGLSGCVDTVLVLVSDSQGTRLCGRGRDLEEVELAVEFDKEICRWRVLGDAADVRRSDERGRILAVLEDSGEAMTPTEISDATGMRSTNVRQTLGRMVRAGEVSKLSRGRYAHPSARAGHNGHNSHNDADYEGELE